MSIILYRTLDEKASIAKAVESLFFNQGKHASQEAIQSITEEICKMPYNLKQIIAGTESLHRAIMKEIKTGIIEEVIKNKIPHEYEENIVSDAEREYNREVIEILKQSYGKNWIYHFGEVPPYKGANK